MKKAKFDNLVKGDIIRDRESRLYQFIEYRNENLATFIMERWDEDENGELISDDIIFDEKCEKVYFTRAEVEKCEL